MKFKVLKGYSHLFNFTSNKVFVFFFCKKSIRYVEIRIFLFCFWKQKVSFIRNYNAQVLRA